MKTPVIVLLSSLGTAILLFAGFIIGASSVSFNSDTCWKFDPTTDITAFELAAIVNIWGTPTMPGPLKIHTIRPDFFKPETGDFIDRQFKRCDQ